MNWESSWLPKATPADPQAAEMSKREEGLLPASRNPEEGASRRGTRVRRETVFSDLELGPAKGPESPHFLCRLSCPGPSNIKLVLLLIRDSGGENGEAPLRWKLRPHTNEREPEETFKRAINSEALGQDPRRSEIMVMGRTMFWL